MTGKGLVSCGLMGLVLFAAADLSAADREVAPLAGSHLEQLECDDCHPGATPADEVEDCDACHVLLAEREDIDSLPEFVLDFITQDR